MATVKPDLLCFDFYPSFGDCGWAVGGGDVNRTSDTRDRYLANLQFINHKALAAGISYCTWTLSLVVTITER